MAPRIRLKTKLVLAISGMVVAVVATLSSIYITHLVKQRVEDSYVGAQFVGHQVFHATREAFERTYLEELLRTASGSLERAAELSGMPVSTIAAKAARSEEHTSEL